METPASQSPKRREDCPHFEDGRCLRHKYGGRPSERHCMVCLNGGVIGGEIKAVPREKWPRYARRLAARAKPGDRGVGDVVKRIAGKAGGERFRRVYKSITGKDCGCDDRQARLNALYPFGLARS